MGKKELETRGPVSRRRCFTTKFDWPSSSLVITNDRRRIDVFPLSEVEAILERFQTRFGSDWFPLANNVEKMGDGTEKPGFGMTIMELTGNVTHAQASSYLGPLLESLGYLEWNGKHTGIQWRLNAEPPSG